MLVGWNNTNWATIRCFEDCCDSERCGGAAIWGCFSAGVDLHASTTSTVRRDAGRTWRLVIGGASWFISQRLVFVGRRGPVQIALLALSVIVTSAGRTQNMTSLLCWPDCSRFKHLKAGERKKEQHALTPPNDPDPIRTTPAAGESTKRRKNRKQARVGVVSKCIT
jgi:hypothetical protein